MEKIIYLLSHYKYIMLLPLAVVEGPILAVIAGFLCTSGLLNPLIVFPVIVFGDVIGDSLCYCFGRSGILKPFNRLGRFLGLRQENIERVKTYFDENPVRTISLSKITLGIGVAGIYLAGVTRIAYPRFIRICVATSFFQYIFYLGIGLLFGGAYIQISHYLNYIASITIIAAIALLFFLVVRRMLYKL